MSPALEQLGQDFRQKVAPHVPHWMLVLYLLYEINQKLDHLIDLVARLR
jgi:hypothetical protein